MKSFKFFAAAALAAAALGQSAWANSTLHIYLTGSTAFRSADLPAIASALGITGTSTPPLLASGGTGNDTAISGTGNTTFIWEGGSVGGTPVTVCATFTGSESGVQTTTGKIAVPFLNDSDLAAPSHPSTKDINNASAYSDIQGTVANPNYATHVPDFCFSDVYQSTTPFNGIFSGKTYAAGNDNQVGICTFKWMASYGFPLGNGSAGATTTFSTLSVEPNSLNQLFSSGLAPLSMLTGNSAQRNIELYATGRNPDSGTRATALADSGYGVGNFVQQYEPTAQTGTQVTQHVLFPVETIAGISTGAPGNSGQATGGNLRAYMLLSISPTVTSPSPGESAAAGTTAAYYITYLGTADAAKVEGNTAGGAGAPGGAVELAYKGVNFSIPAIYDGQYTFWSYEHVIDTGLTSTKATFENSVITTISNYATGSSQLSGVGIGLNDPLMQVERAGDGQVIQPLFNF